MAGAATPGADPGKDSKSAFEIVVGKATDKFDLWQQLPAWILGGAAIVGGAFLIAFPKSQSRNAWAAVIVALFLAVLLSYRSAFTLNEDGTTKTAGDANAAGRTPNAAGDTANAAGQAPKDQP
jgi:hypothetical protein